MHQALIGSQGAGGNDGCAGFHDRPIADHKLRTVGHEDAHPLAPPDPESNQGGGHPIRQLFQLRIADFSFLVQNGRLPWVLRGGILKGLVYGYFRVGGLTEVQRVRTQFVAFQPGFVSIGHGLTPVFFTLAASSRIRCPQRGLPDPGPSGSRLSV